MKRIYLLLLLALVLKAPFAVADGGQGGTGNDVPPNRASEGPCHEGGGNG